MPKIFKICLPNDGVNKDKETFVTYQCDGVTIDVPKNGKFIEVPEWLAKRAKEIGDITDYIEYEI